MEKTKKDKLKKVKRRERVCFWFSLLLWSLAVLALIILTTVNRFDDERAKFWSLASVTSAAIGSLLVLTHLRLKYERLGLEREIQKEGSVIIIDGVKRVF